jgi:hypothetical protein
MTVDSAKAVSRLWRGPRTQEMRCREAAADGNSRAAPLQLPVGGGATYFNITPNFESEGAGTRRRNTYQFSFSRPCTEEEGPHSLAMSVGSIVYRTSAPVT